MFGALLTRIGQSIFKPKIVLTALLVLLSLLVYYKCNTKKLRTDLANTLIVVDTVRLANVGLKANFDNLQTSFSDYVNKTTNDSHIQSNINQEKFDQLEEYYTKQVKELTELLENKINEPITRERIDKIVKPEYSKVNEINYKALWNTYCSIQPTSDCFEK